MINVLVYIGSYSGRIYFNCSLVRGCLLIAYTRKCKLGVEKTGGDRGHLADGFELLLLMLLIDW